MLVLMITKLWKCSPWYIKKLFMFINILNKLKKPWINNQNLEHLRVFIQSWTNLTEETISNFSSVFSQMNFKAIKSLEIGFEMFNLN